MNKYFKHIMLISVAAFALAACEDVPAPFVVPGEGGDNTDGEISLPYISTNLKEGFTVATTTGISWDLGNTYAKATGYNGGTTSATETWLVSPEIPTGDATEVYVDFDYVIAYTNSLGINEAHQVYVCSEYNSEEPASSQWVKLPFQPKEREDRNSWDMYAANTMQVPAEMLGGSIRVGFLYKCNTTSASTWELTNLKVSTEPGGTINPDIPDVPSDGGTWDAPYTVAQAIANQTGDEVWVHAYIVGSIPSSASSVVLDNMTFTADGASGTNICIAESATETTPANCIPVQLPAGTDARTKLNLASNPNMLGQEVWLKGKTIKYCGAPGLKEISTYTLTAPTAEDDGNGGGSDEPVDGAKGDGSQANPFNAAAAQNYTAALPAGQTTTEKFYIKGIVCMSSKMDISTQYKNATFHISEDGSATGTQFLIFRTSGLNGADITSADDIQVGDEVVVYAALVNYMGNTPETAQGGIITSIKRNGQELNPGGGNEGGDNEGGDTPDVPAGENILENGDFEVWDGGTPLNWKTTTSASNATLAQSTEARTGSYAVSVGYASANKRLGYKETTLPAGTYRFSFYAKATTDSKCQTRIGYVVVKDGTVNASDYTYKDGFVDLSLTDWTQASYDFTLTEETTISLLMMSPKGSSFHTSQNILVDDATLVKLQ